MIWIAIGPRMLDPFHAKMPKGKCFSIPQYGNFLIWHSHKEPRSFSWNSNSLPSRQKQVYNRRTVRTMPTGSKQTNFYNVGSSWTDTSTGSSCQRKACLTQEIMHSKMNYIFDQLQLLILYGMVKSGLCVFVRLSRPTCKVNQ